MTSEWIKLDWFDILSHSQIGELVSTGLSSDIRKPVPRMFENFRIGQVFQLKNTIYSVPITYRAGPYLYDVERTALVVDTPSMPASNYLCGKVVCSVRVMYKDIVVLEDNSYVINYVCIRGDIL